MGLPEAVAHALTLILAMGIATLLSMLLGELVPKGLAIAQPYQVARRIAPVQLAFTSLMKPVVLFYERFS